MNVETQAIKFDEDAAAWAEQQAGYLRALSFDKLDSEHLAKAMDEVAKDEKRELTQRLELELDLTRFHGYI